MAFFNFPHTRTYDTDLGWLIAEVNRVKELLNQYLENAVITFADPITWDITEQYTALTMVVDSDGTAYLSKQPVPAGIDITNTDYWLPVFNYDDNINTLRAQIAYNAQNNATTTAALAAGSLVFWKGLIYKVLVDMPSGTAFIPGTNIEKYTVDQKIDEQIGIVDQKIDEQIGIVDQKIDKQIGIVNDKIDEQIGIVDQKIDDQIASVMNYIGAKFKYNVLDYGVVADNGLDQYDAIFDLMKNYVSKTGGVVYFPAGRYIISDIIFIPENTCIIGDGYSTELYFTEEHTSFGTMLGNTGGNIRISNIRIEQRTTTPAVAGNLPGCIGLGTFKIDYETFPKHGGVSDILRREACSHLIVDNIYSDSAMYLLQTEPYNNDLISDIIYSNIIAPRSLVSIEPSNNGTVETILRATVNNIICDCFRLGNSSYQVLSAYDVHVTNVSCRTLVTKVSEYILENIRINIENSNNNITTNAWTLSGRCVANNMIIVGDSLDSHRGACLYCANSDPIFLSNIAARATFNQMIVNGSSTAPVIRMSNCSLGVPGQSVQSSTAIPVLMSNSFIANQTGPRYGGDVQTFSALTIGANGNVTGQVPARIYTNGVHCTGYAYISINTADPLCTISAPAMIYNGCVGFAYCYNNASPNAGVIRPLIMNTEGQVRFGSHTDTLTVDRALLVFNYPATNPIL